MINYYLENYSPKGTSFADGITTGNLQSKNLSSRGIRTNFVRITSYMPAGDTTLLTTTFSAGTSTFALGSINFGSFTYNQAKLTNLYGQKCVEVDVARLISFSALNTFTIQISGYDNIGNQIYDEMIASYDSGTTSYIATTVRCFKFITNVTVIFSTPSSQAVTMKTTNIIEMPTTDLGYVAPYVIWTNGQPNYIDPGSGIAEMAGYTPSTVPASSIDEGNALPLLDLENYATGANVITILSINTGYGAPIDVTESVKNYMKLNAQDLFENNDKKMIQGFKNYNDASKWKGWVG